MTEKTVTFDEMTKVCEDMGFNKLTRYYTFLGYLVGTQCANGSVDSREYSRANLLSALASSNIDVQCPDVTKALDKLFPNDSWLDITSLITCWRERQASSSRNRDDASAGT